MNDELEIRYSADGTLVADEFPIFDSPNLKSGFTLRGGITA